MPSIVVTQVRSEIGHKPKRRRTLRALGLRGIGQERRLPDRPEIRGMVANVVDLVSLVEVRGDIAQRYPRTVTRSVARARQRSLLGGNDPTGIHSHQELPCKNKRQRLPQHLLHLEEEMTELLGTPPETYDTGDENYPGWLIDRTSRKDNREWVKVEPGPGVVAIHWSTYLTAPSEVFGALLGTKIDPTEDRYGPWVCYFERHHFGGGGTADLNPTFEGSILEAQDELESQSARATFLLVNNSVEAFQWREEGPNWQIGWLGGYESAWRAFALLSNTATDNVTVAMDAVQKLVEGLSK